MIGSPKKVMDTKYRGEAIESIDPPVILSRRSISRYIHTRGVTTGLGLRASVDWLYTFTSSPWGDNRG